MASGTTFPSSGLAVGLTFTDTVSGKSFVLSSVSPPVWSVDRNRTLVVGMGISASGDMSVSRNIALAIPQGFLGNSQIDSGNLRNPPAGHLVVGGRTGAPAFALGVQTTVTGSSKYNDGSSGPSGWGFLWLWGTTGGATSNNAINITRGSTVVASINYAGQVFGNGLPLSSDRTLKSSITDYKESSYEYPVKKWIYAIRNDFLPFQYSYTDVPDMGLRYGYMADDLQKVDSKLVTYVPNYGKDTSNDLGSSPGTPQYFINQDQLLFGAVEAIRELDAEVCRLWKTASPPPPSRSKDNDLWFDPETSKMYMRFNDGTQSQWIQIS
jgi:hypothetical protein